MSLDRLEDSHLFTGVLLCAAVNMGGPDLERLYEAMFAKGSKMRQRAVVFWLACTRTGTGWEGPRAFVKRHLEAPATELEGDIANAWEQRFAQRKYVRLPNH